jgi:hypothetical protein
MLSPLQIPYLFHTPKQADASRDCYEDKHNAISWIRLTAAIRHTQMNMRVQSLHQDKAAVNFWVHKMWVGMCLSSASQKMCCMYFLKLDTTNVICQSNESVSNNNQ